MQAKAGKAEEAIGTFKAMQQGGLPPTTWSLNILLSACARTRQPVRAKEIMEDLTSQGVKSDVMTWNTLLSAFARAKHIDGAYQVWQQMQQSGVTPDRFTQVGVFSSICRLFCWGDKNLRSLLQACDVVKCHMHSSNPSMHADIETWNALPCSERCQRHSLGM